MALEGRSIWVMLVVILSAALFAVAPLTAGQSSLATPGRTVTVISEHGPKRLGFSLAPEPAARRAPSADPS